MLATETLFIPDSTNLQAVQFNVTQPAIIG